MKLVREDVTVVKAKIKFLYTYPVPIQSSIIRAPTIKGANCHYKKRDPPHVHDQKPRFGQIHLLFIGPCTVNFISILSSNSLFYYIKGFCTILCFLLPSNLKQESNGFSVMIVDKLIYRS